MTIYTDVFGVHGEMPTDEQGNALLGWLYAKAANADLALHPDAQKFRDYFDYEEPIHRVPSHRALAVFRGRSLDILEAKLVQAEEPEPGQPSLAEGRVALHLGWRHQGRDGLYRQRHHR